MLLLSMKRFLDQNEDKTDPDMAEGKTFIVNVKENSVIGHGKSSE